MYVPLRGTELVPPSIFPRLRSLRSLSLGLLRASLSEAVSHCGAWRMGINPTHTLGDRGLFPLEYGDKTLPIGFHWLLWNERSLRLNGRSVIFQYFVSRGCRVRLGRVRGRPQTWVCCLTNAGCGPCDRPQTWVCWIYSGRPQGPHPAFVSQTRIFYSEYGAAMFDTDILFRVWCRAV